MPSTYTTSASSAATNALCGAGSNHNFQITVTQALRKQYQGLPLFVHGERVTGTSMNAMLDRSGTVFFPLDTNLTGRLMPGVPRVFATPAMLQSLLPEVNPGLSATTLWQTIVAHANQALLATPLAPYYGSRCLPPDPDQPLAPSFKGAVEGDDRDDAVTKSKLHLSELPYLALACQVSGGSYCGKGIELLLSLIHI